MVKIKKLLLLLLLIVPSVIAAEQTFTSPLTITTINNNTTNNLTQVNISIESFNRIFNCDNTSSSNSYNVDIKRNVSDSVDLSGAFSNLTQNVNGLASTCDKITQQYGDINKYFTLYASCNTDFELCKIGKTSAEQRVTDLTPFKSSYDTCSTNLGTAQNENKRLSSEVLPAIQSNMTSCYTDLKKADSNKFIWAIGGALFVAVLWTLEKRKLNQPTSRNKQTGLGDRVG